MRIFLALIMWAMIPAAIGLSGCDLPDASEIERKQKFDREAVLAKTCGVDQGISITPLKVYWFDKHYWFKDNLVWRQIDAGIDRVCDVLDIDAQDVDRRSRRNRYGPRRTNQWRWLTRRLDLVNGS
jgi:hypothetical protein